MFLSFLIFDECFPCFYMLIIYFYEMCDLSAISSEKVIALNIFMRLSPPGTHFTAESTEAMQTKCLAQGHNILMLPGFEPSTSVSRNGHPNHMTNILCL